MWTGGAFWRAKTTSYWGKLPGSVFSLIFLAKPGAERAQLGVFGHSGAIEAIYFAF
jgi:hypothetical protein